MRSADALPRDPYRSLQNAHRLTRGARPPLGRAADAARRSIADSGGAPLRGATDRRTVRDPYEHARRPSHGRQCAGETASLAARRFPGPCRRASGPDRTRTGRPPQATRREARNRHARMRPGLGRLPRRDPIRIAGSCVRNVRCSACDRGARIAPIACRWAGGGAAFEGRQLCRERNPRASRAGQSDGARQTSAQQCACPSPRGRTARTGRARAKRVASPPLQWSRSAGTPTHPNRRS